MVVGTRMTSPGRPRGLLTADRGHRNRGGDSPPQRNVTRLAASRGGLGEQQLGRHDPSEIGRARSRNTGHGSRGHGRVGLAEPTLRGASRRPAPSAPRPQGASNEPTRRLTSTSRSGSCREVRRRYGPSSSRAAEPAPGKRPGIPSRRCRSARLRGRYPARAGSARQRARRSTKNRRVNTESADPTVSRRVNGAPHPRPEAGDSAPTGGIAGRSRADSETKREAGSAAAQTVLEPGPALLERASKRGRSDGVSVLQCRSSGVTAAGPPRRLVVRVDIAHAVPGRSTEYRFRAGGGTIQSVRHKVRDGRR